LLDPLDSLDLPEAAETRGFGGTRTGVPRGEAEALETRTAVTAEMVRALATEMPTVRAVLGVPEGRQTILRG
jgi:hypothetical protein